MKPLEYLSSRESATRVGLAAFAGVLWMLAFPGFDLWPLCFVGCVPLLLATERSSLRETWLLASLAGTIFQAGVCSWFLYMSEKFLGAGAPISWFVWLALSFWAGQHLALTFVGHRLLQRVFGLPSFVTLPVAGVVVWPLFPSLLYYTLGTGMWSAPFAIQPIEIFGPHGLDAMLLLANAALFELLRTRARAVNKVGVAVSLALVALWLGAGAVMVSSWDARVASWSTKKIGLVQPMRDSSFVQLKPEPGYTRDFPVEMKMTERLAEQGAEVVIWPEGHLYGTLWAPYRAGVFAKHAQRIGVDLLIHDKGPDPKLGKKRQRNSSVLFRRDGSPASYYHKRKLVPFGEYYPVVGYRESLRKQLGIPPSLYPGKEAVVFDDVAGMKLVPLICYEVQFGPHSARTVGADGKGKVIVVQSNDGWYGPGSASAHHRASTVLRAVESRLPAIHALNSGETSVILPNGRYAFLAPNWVRGEYLVDMPYDAASGGSFYSAHAGWLLLAVRVALLVFALAFFVLRRRRTAAAPV